MEFLKNLTADRVGAPKHPEPMIISSETAGVFGKKL